jgi:hypothetical protein
MGHGRRALTRPGRRPRGGEFLDLTIHSDAIQGELDARGCLATNDPDYASGELTLRVGDNGSNGLAIGKPALDFTLTGLDGIDYTLSEQADRPVLLFFFATW